MRHGEWSIVKLCPLAAQELAQEIARQEGNWRARSTSQLGYLQAMAKPKVRESAGVEIGVEIFYSDSGSLRLERTAAAAGFRGVGVLESEAPFLESVEKVDRRAIEIQRAFLVDDDRYSMAVELRIGIARRVWIEA